MHTCVSVGQEGVTPPGAGVAGGCEPLSSLHNEPS